MNPYLTRNRQYQRKAPSRDAKKVYIFCEGDREVSYFKYFSGISSNIDIIPIGNKDGKSDPVKLKEQAIDYFKKTTLSPDYRDEVWFVIDTDHWNENGKITELKTFCSQKKTDKNSWEVNQSNPSFEIWLYYHFFGDKPQEDEVRVNTTFKEYLNHKIKGGFDTRKAPIHIRTAIDNSLKHFEKDDKEQPIRYTTEVHCLAQSIYPYIREMMEEHL
ncbi:RloB family protein [Capnocytophaga gingivalis]|jgi:hypothetical protein|uniref:RloB family protein n=1 Tax=Capnocytophaga gingivalis TaxID=1017 RepID=UPI0028EAD4E3|nr:RloB family protein [Capnocytophaga gingivalis]